MRLSPPVRDGLTNSAPVRPALKPGLRTDMQDLQPNAAGLLDRFGRRVSYLRVSITDRCNLRCWYCMPRGCQWLSQSELLSYEELLQVITAGARLGISKVRITGGEPLVRKGLPSFINRLIKTEGLTEVALTTNGTLLAEYAADLKSAGLHRVNISIDTLDAERYTKLTRGGCLGKVIAGIEAAIAAGFPNVKLNAVLQRDSDINDIRMLLEFSKAKRATLRFIELMPLLRREPGKPSRLDDLYISGDEVKAQLGDADLGHVEFLSPVSRPFCETCNRLRLTSDGKLLACLCRGGFVDVKGIVRSGGASTQRQLEQAFGTCLELKPEPWDSWGESSSVARVSAIGG